MCPAGPSHGHGAPVVGEIDQALLSEPGLGPGFSGLNPIPSDLARIRGRGGCVSVKVTFVKRPYYIPTQVCHSQWPALRLL